MAQPAVRVDGLRELRAALRELGPAAGRDLRARLREAAALIAVEARRDAPRGDPDKDPHAGLLQSKIRATTSGNQAAVVAATPYAGVHEWGGIIRPRGVPIEIERSRYIGRALHDELALFMEHLDRSFDQLVRERGWR